MKTRVFISKDLDEKSVFRQLLEEAGFDVLGTSLLRFEAVAFNSVPPADWVFFYSKRGVRFFLQQHVIPTSMSVAAIGPGTAQALEDKGYSPQFTGSGRPEEVANAFEQQAAGQRVLFPRAAHSRRSIQQLLQAKLRVVDLIVYRNEMRRDFSIPPCLYLVFTSPLNVKAYFSMHENTGNQRIIAIGKTTGESLNNLFADLPYTTAAAPTEEALARCVLDWELQSPGSTF